MMMGKKYLLQMLADADFDCIRKGTRSWRDFALRFAADVSAGGPGVRGVEGLRGG